MVNFEEFLKPEACGQTVLPDRSVLIGQKIGGKYQNCKIEMRLFGVILNNARMTNGQSFR